MRETAADALAQLGHPEIRPDALVADLSPAAQQLVEVARALASGARVVVLDEPTSSLAHADVERLFALIRRLKAQGLAIVYISHFIEEVKAISDRFVVLARRPQRGRRCDGGAAGRDHRAPDGRPRGRRSLSAQRETARRGAARAERAAAGRRVADAAPRRDRRHRRPARRGTHASAADDLRARGGAQRPYPHRCVFRAGVAVGALGAGRRHAERESRERRAGDRSQHRRQSDALAVCPISGPGFLVLPSRQAAAASRWMRAHRHPQRRAAAGGGRAVGRQSAEGGARAAAASRRRSAGSRRADARDRRRQQGADLRAAGFAGGGSDGSDRVRPRSQRTQTRVDPV